MKRLVTASLVLSILLASAATPASAEFKDKAQNTGINLLFGVADCPKAWGDELSRGGVRSVVGAVITGPLMCGTNVAVRYLGVAADILTLPVGDNTIKPNALDRQPPVRLP